MCHFNILDAGKTTKDVFVDADLKPAINELNLNIISTVK